MIIAKRVTIAKLDELAANGTNRVHALYCPKCGGTYSADNSDYFMMLDNRPFKCCGRNNYLIQR